MIEIGKSYIVSKNGLAATLKLISDCGGFVYLTYPKGGFVAMGINKLKEYNTIK